MQCFSAVSFLFSLLLIIKSKSFGSGGGQLFLSLKNTIKIKLGGGEGLSFRELKKIYEVGISVF